MTDAVHDLLAGPRGRRVCLELVRALGADPLTGASELGTAVFLAAYALDPGRGSSVVLFGWGAAASEAPPEPSPAEVARLIDAADLAALDDARTLRTALVASTDSARYWQEPDGEDVLAAEPEVVEALARVAEAVESAEAARWWRAPIAHDGQWMLRREPSSVAPGSPGPAGAEPSADVLASWRLGVDIEERTAARDRPTDPHARWSGTWWSTPPSTLARSTRDDGLGPVALDAVEDGMGWERATALRVVVPDSTRVLEIDGTDAWADLCARHPIEVTASRRHDWFRTTGRDGAWAVPDWASVADEFDAVHLTVAGYLAAAGRAIDLGDGRASVVAGWGPDETMWLRDVPLDETSARRFALDDRDRTWRLAAR
ncbi:hypothetical protein ET445_16930 [Agromyces protaetiae]|uniref:Uncharacterized protein n=1 Tax=Agromyces protaetiae TaxID=2509455 RepID=A0A4P6FL56_9MICO|nr:hypothetical protein [Agromyces protaetiae]QAY74767.1 hypothetical protein ET445_16930 [Agromyces protaetiae]